MGCVIGSDVEAIEVVAEVLVDYAAIEVDRLVLDLRCLDLVRRRDYGLVIVDAHPTDPIAVLNELGRRLGMARRRGVATVLIHGGGPLSPALELFCATTSAAELVRPFDVPSLLAAVAEATGATAGSVGAAV